MEVELMRKGNEPSFPKLRTEQMRVALRTRFCQPEWALFFEVADGTGASQRRWADAMAMNMWGSRGLALHGFEIKVSRSDWKRELANPAKAESIAGLCDFWSIVAPKGMIPLDELPPGWGLLEVDSDLRIAQRVTGPKNTNPAALTRSFVASLLRSAAKVDESIIRGAIDIARSDWEKTVEERIRQRTEYLCSDGAEALKLLDEFKELSGIDLRSYKWDAKKLHKALVIAESGIIDRWGGLERMVEHLEEATKLATALKTAIDSDPN